MKTFRFVSSLIAFVMVLFLVSCETTDKSPKPEREKLSSMPHNMPASWEGQGGMPGMMSGQY